MAIDEVYSVGEMARKLHKTVRTLQQWDRDGVLIAHRTPTGRRFYTRNQLLEYFGETVDPADKRTVAYCRVSSQTQKPDLKNQRTVAHRDRLARFGFEHIEWECENAGCEVEVLNAGLKQEPNHWRLLQVATFRKAE